MRNWQQKVIDKVIRGERLTPLRAWLNPSARKLAADTERLADLLTHSTKPINPPASLRNKLMDELETSADRGMQFVTTHDRRWHKLLPGIQVCMLSRADSHRSVLLKIAAGYALPRHNHRRIEQAIVLEGSCYSGDVLLKTGDFFLAQAQTRHEPVRAVEDCLILVIAHR